MAHEPRQAARNAWVDGQMAAAAAKAPRSVRETIMLGVLTGASAATSTVIVSVTQWAMKLLLGAL